MIYLKWRYYYRSGLGKGAVRQPPKFFVVVIGRCIAFLAICQVVIQALKGEDSANDFR
jgi:hypothetical protein